MLQKIRLPGVSGLQLKLLLLIISVILVLLAIFLYYDVQVQRTILEEALLQKGKGMALSGAAAIGHVFEDALTSGRLTEAQIFDTVYQPIPGTDPLKYQTAYDSFTDVNFLRLQDVYLNDSDVLYAIASDTNGYVPSHNTRYAQPLTGDYETDLVNNRTKRIFNDDVGFTASQNKEGTLRQIYFRDTGEVAWDISAPILVNGRHWGAFRVGFSLASIDAQIGSLTRRITTAGALLIVGVGIASFLIARQISQPIQTLAAAAEKVGQGDFEIDVEVRSKDEVGQLAAAFKVMAYQLRDLVNTLEQQVAARTQRLEIVAVLSERLNAILDFDQLLLELVNQVKNSFDYYHAHVYIIDHEYQNLVMTAGAGEAGAKMKAQSHQIALNAPTSLVARAARTGEIVWVENVREAKDWLPNPLLPDTYSEMAVPIIIEGHVVGVLDVQQNRVAGLDEGDAGLLRSLANQVAVTIRNARLFNKVETALAEARAVQEQYMEQAWEKIKIEQRRGGQYVYVAPKAAPLDEAKKKMMTETRRQVLANKRLEVVAVNGGDVTARSLVAPITIHAKTIGALQLHTSSDNPSWSGDDLAVIEAVVDQLAQTADNLRLFDETRNRVGREQTIREITEKMRAAISLDQLVKITAEELGQRLSAGHAVVEFGIETDKY